MRKTILSILLVTFALLLQITLGPRFPVLGITPDLFAVAVLLIGSDIHSRAGFVAGFSGGLVLDVLFGYPLGLRMILYALMGYIAGTGILCNFWRFLRLTVLAFLLTLTNEFLHVLLLFVQQANMSGSMMPRMLLIAVANAMLILPLQFLTGKLTNKHPLGRTENA